MLASQRDHASALAAEVADALPSGHEAGIASALADSIDRLAPTGRDFLRLAAVLAPEPIALGLVADVLAQADALDENTARGRARAGMREAEESTLARRDGADGSCLVPSLVAHAVRRIDPDDPRRDDLRGAAVTVVARDLDSAAVLAHGRQLAGGPPDEHDAMLIGRIAHHDYEHGEYDSAAALADGPSSSCGRSSRTITRTRSTR